MKILPSIGKYQMLKQRIFTAIILVALLIGMLFSLSSFFFSLAIVPVVVLAGWEWTHLMKMSSKAQRLKFVAILILLLIISGIGIGMGDSVRQHLAYGILLIASALWIVIFCLIFIYPSGTRFWSKTTYLSALGLLILLFTWIAIVYIQFLPSGNNLLLAAFAIIALSDVGGFIFGKLLGRHKLAPMISPGKTWEGFLGALILELLLVVGLNSFGLFQLSVWELSALVLIVALASVGGDLFESMVKRNIGVKDSGGLLPGHGGVLDRIDGMMSALPIYAVLLPFAQTA
jgi:phosphatidate cytidylyltransferase